jgi:hypothetical protein
MMRRKTYYEEDVIREELGYFKKAGITPSLNEDAVRAICTNFNETVKRLLLSGAIVDLGYCRQYVKKRGTNKVMTDKNHTFKIVSTLDPNLKNKLIDEDPDYFSYTE